MKVGIIDIGMGNLTSVKNAFAALDCPASILKNPEDLASAERIVLPGVGAFGDAMQQLRAGRWISDLQREVLVRKKPFLGICLGMQVLAEQGNEHGTHTGLGWIPGQVDRLSGSPEHRVPHIGWDDIDIRQDDCMYAGIGKSRDFYFVHSFVLHPQEADLVTGTCTYGECFAASIRKENIWATQYHPEKSQKAGLLVLKNFLQYGV